MNLYKMVAEATEQKARDVRDNYEAFIKVVRKELKENRRIRLPGLGILAVKTSPAREKRKGKSPFTGEMMTFKAKPALNKVKFRPAKDLKEYANKLEKIVPKKKKSPMGKNKKGKKSKK